MDLGALMPLDSTSTSYLSSTSYEDERRRADYLRILTRGWLVFGAIALATIPIYPYWQVSLAIVFATGLTFVATGALLRAGKLRSACLAFCICINLTFFLVFLTLSWLLGPNEAFRSQAPILMLMGLTALIAAALLGPKAALAVAAFNTALMIGTRLAIAPTSEPRPSILISYWLVAGIAFLYENSLNGVFAELRGVREGLEQTVANRTAELRDSVARLEKTTEKLIHANKDLDLFSATVAHDLRNPLLIIEGYSRALQDKVAAQSLDTARSLEQILAAEARMQRLIDGLMEFARLGQHALRIERIDMTSLTQRLIDEFRSLEKDRAIFFTIDPLPECSADPTLIEQVMANLLSNALKYTRLRPTAQITVKGWNRNDETIYAVIDNGVGFAMQDAEHVFKPLRRLHAQEAFEGTGIGLAAVERMIELHGGKVWAESEPDKGATFFFSLPIKK